MIDLPFRIPWRTLSTAMAAGVVAGALVLVHLHALRLGWGETLLEDDLDTWMAKALVLEGCLLATLFLHIALKRDHRVWWTLPATFISVVFNMAMADVSRMMMRMIGSLSDDTFAAWWPMDPLEVYSSIVLLSLYFLLIDTWLYAVTAGVVLRYSWTWTWGGALWIAAIILALVFCVGYLNAYLTDETFKLLAIPISIWAQCFWIGLPWFIQEARGKPAGDASGSDK